MQRLLPSQPDLNSPVWMADTAVWVGLQLERGSIEPFPPRLPEGDGGDLAPDAKVGGS
ncbi:hypothetical protein Ate01nite_65570 [Actinoplanes teichomyceticus]|nr:hypothetical protein Ate01nite_65570 [Actinoplanes teichomyceticus]